MRILTPYQPGLSLPQNDIPVQIAGLPRPGPTATLPAQLQTWANPMFDDFEDISGWTAVSPSDVTIAADTTNFITGAQGLKLTRGTNAVKVQKTINQKFNGYFRIFFYCPVGLEGMRLLVSSSAAFSHFFQSVTFGPFRNNWNFFNICPNDFTTPGGPEDWANTMVRMQLSYQTATNGRTCTFDSLYANIRNQPIVLLELHDVYTSHYTFAYPALKARGQHATMWAQSAFVNTAGHMDDAQLREVAASGVIAVGNHSDDGTNLPGLTPTQVRTHLDACKTALQGWGVGAYADHVLYPGGNHDSNTFVAMAQAPAYKVGNDTIAGHEGLPTVNNDNTAAYAMYELRAAVSTDNNTFAAVKAQIDSALLRGDICRIFAHDIQVNSGASVTAQSTFLQVLDYCVSKQIPVLNIADYWQLTQGPLNAAQQHPVGG